MYVNSQLEEIEREKWRKMELHLTTDSYSKNSQQKISTPLD